MPRMVPAAEKADKLSHHDQGTRGRFRQTKSIQHLTGGEPMMRLDSLLRHVGQHCISPTEGDQCSFAEKNPFLNHGVIAAKPKAQQKDRGRP